MQNKQNMVHRIFCILLGCSLFSNNISECTTDLSSSGIPETLNSTNRNELVVLLHGFWRTKRDMSFLENSLQSHGYHVFAPTLPTTFQSLETCTVKFEQKFREIHSKYDRIHFVGHSIGGLIIQLFLSRNRVSALGRCVLIATPNDGTELAGLVARYLKPLMWICKPYQALLPGGAGIPPPINNPPPDIGAIAGNRNTLFLGRFIKRESDGRVPVESVPFDGMKDFIVLPYHHKEIHRRKETAELVRRFLQKGTFEKTAP